MWVQAVCSGKIETFNKRLNILEQYADAPEKLEASINQIRKLVREKQPITLDQEKL